MKLFWKALSERLASDSELVSLLGYSTSNINIVRAETPIKEKRTGIFFMEMDERDWPGADSHELRDTVVDFMCTDPSKIVCSDILDRLEVLLYTNADGSGSLDISTDEIHCIYVKVLDIGSMLWDKEMETNEVVVSALFRWAYKS